MTSSRPRITRIGSLGGVSGSGNSLVFGADGDLAFIGAALFMAANDGNLVEIDAASGVGSAVGPVGFANLFGLATPDNVTR